MTTGIQEIQTMTESQKMYRMYERLEEMYLLNCDYKKALEMKWGMLKWAGESAPNVIFAQGEAIQ